MNRRLQTEIPTQSSIYDVLPSPTNLCVWGKVNEPFCKLCGKPANLAHVLSSCQVALMKERYTWRHNQVLRALAYGMEKERRKKRGNKEELHFNSFRKEGQRQEIQNYQDYWHQQRIEKSVVIFKNTLSFLAILLPQTYVPT